MSEAPLKTPGAGAFRFLVITVALDMIAGSIVVPVTPTLVRELAGGADADGARWVIDYKTSRHEGSDVDTFLDRERARYAEQLKMYREALQTSHAGLYFPLLRGWRQLGS